MMSTAPSRTLKSKSTFLTKPTEWGNVSQKREKALFREEEFTRTLRLELRRSTRSGRRFLLILLEVGALLATDGAGSVREVLAATLLSQSRDTDVVGWYQDNTVMAMLCTEICNPPEDAVKVLYSRLSAAISDRLLPHQAEKSQSSIHIYPVGGCGSGGPDDLVPQPDLYRQVA